MALPLEGALKPAAHERSEAEGGGSGSFAAGGGAEPATSFKAPTPDLAPAHRGEECYGIPFFELLVGLRVAAIDENEGHPVFGDLECPKDVSGGRARLEFKGLFPLAISA